jgi:hypothetical protein
MTPTDHFNDRKLAKDKKHSRSKKSKAYIADKDSASNISSECNDDSDNDTDTLVEVCHLSKESIKKPSLVNGLPILAPRHICLTNLYYSGTSNKSKSE